MMICTAHNRCPLISLQLEILKNHQVVRNIQFFWQLHWVWLSFCKNDNTPVTLTRSFFCLPLMMWFCVFFYISLRRMNSRSRAISLSTRKEPLLCTYCTVYVRKIRTRMNPHCYKRVWAHWALFCHVLNRKSIVCNEKRLEQRPWNKQSLAHRMSPLCAQLAFYRTRDFFPF